MRDRKPPRTRKPPFARPDPPAGAEPTWSLGAVGRLTGLSEHVLRAWERRYGAVRPLRTAGGTRRYREADVARLRLLRAALAAGHSIGEIARLPDPELARRAHGPAAAPGPALGPLLDAVQALDAETLEWLLGAQLAALGPARFARQVAAPLLVEIGERWHAGRLSIACEHLASAIVRQQLGACLRRPPAAGAVAPVLFTTLAGERHELGVLLAAVTAVEAGGAAIFLGGDLPVDEIARAARARRAAAVAIGVCQPGGQDPSAQLEALRAALPRAVELWVGGPGGDALALPDGAAYLDGLEHLARKVELRAARGAGR